MRIPTYLASLTSLLLVTSTCLAAQAPPEYEIDLRFENGAVPLSIGTASESDAYNQETSDPSRYPVFAEQANLHFPTRTVRAYLIGSRHDDSADESFVVDQLRRFRSPGTNAQVFIEQVDLRDPDGASTILQSAVTEYAGELQPILDQSRLKKYSLLNPEVEDKFVFTQVERSPEARGLHVRNFDLSANLSSDALEFLVRQLSLEDAIHFTRADFSFTTFGGSEFQSLFTSLFPRFFPSAQVAQVTDCCGDPTSFIHYFLRANQLRNLVRERYMRHVLSTQLHDGDFIIAHPVHLRHILNPEVLP